MSAPKNRLATMVGKLDPLPKAVRSRALTTLFGVAVPYVGTTGIRFEVCEPDRFEVSLKNKRSARNHIGQLHAGAMVLLGETATGIMVGLNVPDSSVPVIKTIRADFVRRSKGAMRAVATLTPAQQEHIRSVEKGETVVSVTVTDESGREPIVCEMVWAWVPKKRKDKTAA
ncbi:MAG: DUF4442 domain-containing protein [Myxococcales bacterium]|nr:DUF4442 domain-containing protein [Myxococcales bacterium]